MKKRSILLLVLLPIFVKAQNAAPVPDLKDVAYDDDHPAQALDVYKAKSDSPSPVVVYIHGGGWRAGSKNKIPTYLRSGLQRGHYSVVSVEYRFTNVATHPAQVHDCARAIQFIRHNAKEWNIDPKRIAAIGNSAGGHLSLWLALHDDMANAGAEDPVEQQSSRLTCAVSLAGPTDWSLLGKIKHDHPAYRQLLDYKPGTPAEEMDEEKKASVSPITFASKDDPPVLLVHGTADTIVPIEHAKNLQQALRKAGATSQLRIVQDGGHSLPKEAQDVSAVTAYLIRHLLPRAHPGTATKLPKEVIDSLEAHKDITYASYGDRELQLDLYRPESAKGKTLPGIVCIHGGGWWKGNRQSHTSLAMALAARGFVTTTISYRLSGEAKFPAAIHDCKAAVRWLRANAEKYGVNPDQIGAAGLSAGGHLTALLATSAGVKELEGEGGNPGVSSAIQAATPYGAQTDAMSSRIKELSKTSPLWRNFLGGSQEEQTDTYKLASPLTHLDAGDPPILFMAGEFDDPSTHAETFRSKMKELGLETGYNELEGGPHGFLRGQKWFDECVEKSAEFFTEHLK